MEGRDPKYKDVKPYASGTKEWSVASINCSLGCSNQCYYCFAREMAMRFKRISRPVEWGTEEVRRRLSRETKKYDGQVMFPTTHDITPNLLQPAYEVLINLLRAGNRVLIVTKPNLYCVQVLCEALEQWKMAVLFRFTIGCLNGEIAKRWEPFAPPPVERLASLGHAYRRGFKTSVSMEPMLDAQTVVSDFNVMRPLVTNGIWIGTMRHIRKRCVVLRMGRNGVVVQGGVTEEEIVRILEGQSDASIRHIYEQLRDDPAVRWKESIKRMVGLPLETEVGTDR